MRKVLTTFGTGKTKELLKISLPLMAEYALRHGYELYVPSDEMVEVLSDGRPHSWAKLCVVSDLLGWWSDVTNACKRPDIVLWLDADVVPVRMDKDILDDFGGTHVGMVTQRTIDGHVPSCGVAIFHAKSHDYFLQQVWRAAGDDGMGLRKSDGWWEQAALIKALGGDPDAQPIVPPPPSDYWSELPYEWNPHKFDERGIPDDCRFFHATQFEDRAAAMKEWAARCQH